MATEGTLNRINALSHNCLSSLPRPRQIELADAISALSEHNTQLPQIDCRDAVAVRDTGSGAARTENRQAWRRVPLRTQARERSTTLIGKPSRNFGSLREATRRTPRSGI